MALTRTRLTRAGSWYRSAAWYRVPGVAAVAIAVALAAGRADLIVLVAPLVLVWVAGILVTRGFLGARTPHAQTTIESDSFGAHTASTETTVSGADNVAFFSVAQPARHVGAVGAMVTETATDETARIAGEFGTKAWGTISVARPDVLGAGPDGLYLSGPVRRGPNRTELILPGVPEISPLRLPPLTGGWAGAHLSRRPGQGNELVDLRPFAPGDKLRGIAWRAYARHQELYTRRTLSDAEADIVLCLDRSTIIAPRRITYRRSRWAAWRTRLTGAVGRVTSVVAPKRVGEQRRQQDEERRKDNASSLDHMVAAAAAIAGAHFGHGDRVGLVTASIPRRMVRVGSGHRQLQRIRHQLALLTDRRYRVAPVSLWGLRPGQIVIWCSPLATQQSRDVAMQCAARGHLVIVVDTLPLAGVLAGAGPRETDHLRIVTIERELAIQKLRGYGIITVSWDAGDIAGQLAQAYKIMAGRR